MTFVARLMLVLAPAVLANHSAQVRTTAAQEVKQLQGRGAAQHASEVYKHPVRWSFVSDRIATGQPDWLHVAALLNEHADGAFSEELTTDLALALAKRPADVLRLLQHSNGMRRFAPNLVCSAPIPSPGKQRLKTYKARTIEAVGGVHERKLRKVRDDCLQILRNVDLSLPASYYE